MKKKPFAFATLSLACGLGVLAEQPALAEGGLAALSAGGSYSSSRGGLAFAGLDAADLFGSGLDIGLRFETGKDGQASNASIIKTFDLGTTVAGNDSALRLSLEGMSTDWDSQGYSASDINLEIAFAASPVENLTYELRLFGRQNDFGDIGAGVSPLLVAEAVKSDAVGLGAGLEWSSFDDPKLPRSGVKFGADLAWATPAGDREWLAASIYGGAAIPVSSAFTLSVRADAGRIKGLNDQTVSFVDRAFIGSPAPRGFAAAGIGPRDFVSETENTALGGNSYFTSTIELRYQTANPSLSVGTFFDAGALWDLDVVDGGASGTIDDAYHLRTAAGVSIYWQTNIGLMQLNLAGPIKSLEYDEEETISLGISSSF